MIIKIKALNVVTFGNSVYEIEVESQSITQAQDSVLRDLFPNTFNSIDQLLATEALIKSIVK